ncbi:hypothetical protein CENDO_05150 [Corynebacterium endometrii]|uniref:Uncharacterized protein n=1 Tax=Corynebacterium endometrii TaxID=2488819 RepID=A0A4P7QH52_9CORY|nr:hypothetical protein CENDO_05150 [Corynebacterium endometrii]
MARVDQAGTRRRVGGVLAELNLLVVLIDEDDPRAVVLKLPLLVMRIPDDDDEVAGADQAGGGAVDADNARAPVARDGVGGQSVAVVDVNDVDLLPSKMSAVPMRSASIVQEPT